MDTPSGTVTVWQSGRLAPRGTARRFEFRREHWLASALLVLSALVLAAYVMVLQKDVDATALQHLAQHSRAVAEAQCEADQPADQRGRCVALLDGDADVAALHARPAIAPENTAYAAAYEQENLARATTVSLLGAR